MHLKKKGALESRSEDGQECRRMTNRQGEKSRPIGRVIYAVN